MREAAVIQVGGNHLAAVVVPDSKFIDNDLGRAAAESAVVGKWRKIFDLSQLSKQATAAAVGFNTMGWDSSYTRRAIPDEEMREWVENTVGDILSLKPKSLCEIGCGTGMLVMRLPRTASGTSPWINLQPCSNGSESSFEQFPKSRRELKLWRARRPNWIVSARTASICSF